MKNNLSKRNLITKGILVNRFRSIAVVALLVIGIPDGLISGVIYELTICLLLAGLVIIYNSLGYIYIKKKGRDIDSNRVVAVIFCQLLADVIITTCLVHFTRGIDSPYSFFYFFPVVSVAVGLSNFPRFGYFIAAAINISYDTLLFLEFFKIIPPPDVYPWLQQKYANPILIVCFAVLVPVTFWVITYFLVQANKMIQNREEALESSEQRFREVIENAEEWVWEVDFNGLYTFSSGAMENILGYKLEEFVGKKYFFDLFHPENREELKNSTFELFKQKKSFRELITRNVSKNGEIVLLSKSGVPTLDNNGNLLGYRGIDVNITERRSMEEQLRQAQKMESVGRLAGGVAHDYNNSLSVIIGFTELAMEAVAPSEPLHADLNEVLNAARRATDITRQLLAFARKQIIAPKVLELNENVESILKMLRRLIGEEINLAWLPGKNLWTVKVDSSQLDQILVNLCVNARDAITGVGKVTIETRTVAFDVVYCADHAGFIPGEFVMLAVSDNGCGMDKEILDNIFEPFFTTKDIDKGTGLGLATVYGIIKQNNGFINVYSELGKGTTIKIYLPRHEETTVNVQDESMTEILQGRGETILLVEDDLSIMKLTRKILDGLGYNLLTASTPGEAMGKAKDHAGKIHLLVTDVIMPEMNGLELAERLQSLYPNMKRVFMSGYTANVIAHHGVLEEGVCFIQKPFSKRDLTKIVRKVLDKGNNSDL